MKITTYKYEKVPVSDTEIFIPEKPFYCFQTGVRRSIRIIPEFTTWNKERYKKEEEIYQLTVTCVYGSFEAKIEKFSINISEIEQLCNREEKTVEGSIVRMLFNEDYNVRTKEDFEADLQNIITTITE